MNVARRPLHLDDKPAPEVFQQSPPGDLLPPVQRPLAGVAFFNPAAMPGFYLTSPLASVADSHVQTKEIPVSDAGVRHADG